MKRTTLALALTTVSFASLADYNDEFTKIETRKGVPVSESEVSESSLKASDMKMYIQTGQITIDDSDSFEAVSFSVGGQTVKHNSIYAALGGQIAIASNEEGSIDTKDTFVALTTKLGYSFNSKHVAFIPYVGADVGFDIYNYKSSGYYSSVEVSGTEFYTRLFLGAELRLNDTVGIYANKGIITMFETNTDFQEVGVRVSF